MHDEALPTGISPEAWAAAIVIDGAIENYLRDFGHVRRQGASFPVDIARIVQVAIDCSAELRRDGVSN